MWKREEGALNSLLAHLLCICISLYLCWNIDPLSCDVATFDGGYGGFVWQPIKIGAFEV